VLLRSIASLGSLGLASLPYVQQAHVVLRGNDVANTVATHGTEEANRQIVGVRVQSSHDVEIHFYCYDLRVVDPIYLHIIGARYVWSQTSLFASGNGTELDGAELSRCCACIRFWSVHGLLVLPN